MFVLLGMMPFWVYTLGNAVPASEEIGKIKIPYTSMLLNLLQMVGPLAAGVFVLKKFPRIAKHIRKYLKVSGFQQYFDTCDKKTTPDIRNKYA